MVLGVVEIPTAKQRPPLKLGPALLESTYTPKIGLKTLLLGLGTITHNIETEKLVLMDGKTYYRHHHFPGGKIKLEGRKRNPYAGQEVLLETEIEVNGHRVRVVSANVAAYLTEQEEIRKRDFVTLDELNAKIDAAEKTDDSHVLSVSFVREHSETASSGARYFIYPAITDVDEEMQAKEQRLLLVVSGKGYYFKREDADLVEQNEIEKRRKYIFVGLVQQHLQVTFSSIYSRFESGSLEGVKCGPYWYITRESFARAKLKKHVDTDLPEEKVPAAEILEIMGVSQRYLDTKKVMENGKEFFIYDRIKNGKVVEEKIRVYTTADNREYFSKKDIEKVRKWEKANKTWMTREEFARAIERSGSTLSQAVDSGRVRVFLGKIKYVDIPYVVFRRNAIMHPEESRAVIDYLKRKRMLGKQSFLQKLKERNAQPLD